MSAYERSPWWRRVMWREVVSWAVIGASVIATGAAVLDLAPGGMWAQWFEHFATAFVVIAGSMAVSDAVITSQPRAGRRRRRPSNRRRIHVE